MEIRPAISKVSSVYVGRALTNFLNSVDVSETKIGETTTHKNFGVDGSDAEMIYSGHWLHCGDSGPTWLLTAQNKTKLVVTPMFNSTIGKSPTDCVNDYFNWCEESVRSGYSVPDRIDGAPDRIDRNTIVEMVNKLNSHKMVVVPLKYDNVKAVIDIEAEGVKTRRNMEISGIKWYADQETGRLMCSVMLDHRNIGSIGKSKFINITEYGSTMNIEAVSLANSGSKIRIPNAIEYDISGFVKPIELTNGKTSLIVDGTYVYYKNASGTFVVGEWVGNTLKMKYTSSEDKLFKKLESYVHVVSLHKRIIAPYLLVDTKVIKTK